VKEPPNGVSCINTVVKEERVDGVFEEQVLCLPLRPSHLPHLYHRWLRWHSQSGETSPPSQTRTETSQRRTTSSRCFCLFKREQHGGASTQRLHDLSALSSPQGFTTRSDHLGSSCRWKSSLYSKKLIWQ